jgi:hypothetical protein
MRKSLQWLETWLEAISNFCVPEMESAQQPAVRRKSKTTLHFLIMAEQQAAKATRFEVHLDAWAAELDLAGD